MKRRHDSRPLPATPTLALPGSPEKLAVLEARAAAGVQLFHPRDGDAEDRPQPLPPGGLYFRPCAGRPASITLDGERATVF